MTFELLSALELEPNDETSLMDKVKAITLRHAPCMLDKETLSLQWI